MTTGAGGPEGGRQGGNRGGNVPEKIQLTPEERAVLLECRRQSMIRGFAAGGGFCGLVYWFKAQGRVPSFVTKFPGLTYGLGFLAAFMTGANSYRKTCFQKLMNLENSFIADKFREVSEKIKEEKEKNARGKVHTQAPKPPSKPVVKREKEEPPINVHTYNKDKAMLDTSVEGQEPPSAFSGSANSSQPPTYSDPSQDTAVKKRRTFDDIREENRRRYGQQSYPSSPSQSSRGSADAGNERKKRNKYGDIIED